MRWLRTLCFATSALIGVAGPPDHARAQGSDAGLLVANPARASPELRKAWDGYYAALDEMRDYIERTPMFQDPQNRAKAYHSLMEMQGLTYTWVIAPRKSNPRFLVNTGMNTDIFTLGLNGPDCLYAELFLDGRQVYRIRGRRGDITFFSILVQNNLLGEEGNKTIGSYDLSKMKVAPDGRFEIIVGGPKRQGNWIALDPNSDHNFLHIRRTVPDWGDSDKGELTIDRISPIDPGHYDSDEFSEAAMAVRLHRAELFIRYMPKAWMLQLYEMFLGPKGEKNTMTLLPGMTTNPTSEPTSNYAAGVFSLKDDEALIVSLDKVPDGAYWGFQLADVWDRALPFYERQTSLNNTQVKIDADGGLRLVISRKDPGVANWLDPADRREGEIVLRNYGSHVPSVPVIRKVKFDELRANLPPGTIFVTPEERRKALDHRHEAVIKLYGE